MSIFDDYKNSSLNPLDMFKRDDPNRAANKYMDRIPGVGAKYFNPYIEGGREAGGRLHDEYSKQLDPTHFMDEIMKHYQESQGATYERDKLGKGIGSAAAAGGVAGTPEHQRQYGEMAGDIMSKDMQQYLQNALGIHASGLQGEQDFYNKGFDASGRMADLEGGTLASQGTLAYQGANQKNQNRMALFNAISKALSQSAGAGL